MDEQILKRDFGKPKLSLVPFQIVYDIAKVREYGINKYGDSNSWKEVEYKRYVNALLRHVLAFSNDIESVDEESNLPHLWHVACNVAFLCDILKEKYL